MAQPTVYKDQAQHLAPHGMRNFTLIWLGQVVSLLGSGMFCLAQSIWVYTDLGGTITHLALISLCARLPGLLISPLAGALVDRWDRRWVMIVSDSVAALGTLSLRILIVTDSYELWHLFVITAVLSIANQFQWPAYFATVSLMVPKQQLGYANGLIQIGQSLVGVAAPFLAGVAVTLFKIQGVILFDLSTYLFALSMLLIIPIPKPPTTPAGAAGRGSLVREIIHGWKYLIARHGLLSLLVFFSISNLFFNTAGFLVIPLALSFTHATVLGSAMAIGGVGMLVGSLVMTVWGGPKRRIYGVLGFMLIQGAAITVAGLRASVPLLFGAYGLFAFTVPFINACSGMIWQSKVAPDVQGRVLAASSTISNITPSLALVFAGPLADFFETLLAESGSWAPSVGQIIGTGPGRGIGFMFIIMGILSTLVTLGGYLYPRIRLLDKELPDVIPDKGLAMSLDS